MDLWSRDAREERTKIIKVYVAPCDGGSDPVSVVLLPRTQRKAGSLRLRFQAPLRGLAPGSAGTVIHGFLIVTLLQCMPLALKRCHAQAIPSRCATGGPFCTSSCRLACFSRLGGARGVVDWLRAL